MLVKLCAGTLEKSSLLKKEEEEEGTEAKLWWNQNDLKE